MCAKGFLFWLALWHLVFFFVSKFNFVRKTCSEFAFFDFLVSFLDQKFGLCIYTSTFNYSITQKGFQSIVVNILLLYFENPFEPYDN